MKGVQCSWVDMQKIRSMLKDAERGTQARLERMRCVDKSTISTWKKVCEFLSSTEGKVDISQLSCFQPSHAREISRAFRKQGKSLEEKEVRNEVVELVDRCEDEKLTVKQLRALLRNQKQPIPPLPKGTYEILLADPPWRYDFSETESREVENQYPTLTVEEITALKVPAADSSVLFLWATMPKLREALLVMEAWGFKYKSGACWDKEKIGMGYWFRGQHELLLVGTVGRFSPPPEGRRVSSVFRGKRAEHSEKPACVYEAIEFMFPERFDNPKKPRAVELFCRSPRPGWSSWGNEV